MTLIATVAIIALIAVGVGYAYTAITTNSGNDAGIEYITLKQGGDGAYNFIDAPTQTVYWDSNDYLNGTTYTTEYTLTSATVAPVSIAGDGDYIAVQLGDSFKLIAQPQDGGAADANGLDVEITSTGIKSPAIAASQNYTVNGEIVLLFVVAGETGTPTYFKASGTDTYKKFNPDSQEADKWEAGNSFNMKQKTATTYEEQTITVYIGYKAEPGKITITNVDNKDRPMPVTKPLTGATLQFKATLDGSNIHGVSVTALAITGEATVAATEDLQLGVTVTPDEATNKLVVWSSSDDSIATVAGGVVHGVKGGTVTIKVTSLDSGVTATKVITVTAAITVTSGSTVNVASGATSQIAATVSGAGVITYVSSDEAVATVSETGLITAVAGGQATITLSSPGAANVEITVNVA